MAARTALRSGRLGFALLGAVLITFLALSGQARAAIGDGPALPSISSDKTDYAPGELVTLTGANWAAGESVHVVVNDDAGQTWRYENDATAADNGSFSLQFNLPDWFVAVYTVTAGGSSGTATTTFTDANVVFTSPAVTRFPGAGFQSVAKGASHDFSATVNRNGGGVDPQIIGAQTQTGNPACADPAPPTMPLSWLSVRSGAVTASSSTPIAVSGSTSIALRVSVPSGAAPGDYQGRFRLALQAGTGNANDNLNFCITVPADTTPPVITPTVTGTLGSNGWYTSDVAMSWTVSDPDSAITSQSGCNSSDVTSDTSGVTFTCTATSAGGTASSSVTVKRDATAPEVTVNLARDPDHNGWYNHGLGYRAVGSDVLSGLADCDPGALYSGPDDENASVSLTCRDEAGNEGTGSRSFMYDSSAPTVAINLVREPDHNGWYTHGLGYRAVGSDATSGVADCDPGAVYSGPDDENASVSLSCRDNAGNEGTGSRSFKYDATAPSVSATPSRTPDHNGWYNAAFSVSYSGTDATSGIESCSPDDDYSGPDTEDGSLSGSCSDNAGNSASASYSFMYDATAPSVTINLAREPDHNGWYTHGLGYRAVGSDATSGVADCDPGAVYSGPDDENASVSLSCRDNAGNEGTGSANFMYDATAPSVTVNLARDPDRMGWYNHGVGYRAVGSDATSGVADCDPGAVYSGPDDENASVSLSCRDNAGNEGTGSRSFMFDATPPTIVATLDPPANSNGWNNTDVTVQFTCDDNLSGIDPSYGCPAHQVLTSQGLHTLHVATSDVAGNVVTPSFDVRIDKTNPSISGSASPAPNTNGWNNTNVVVSFSCFDALSGIAFCEPDHTLSSNGAGQSVTGDARDKADNESSATVSGINIDKLAPAVAVTGVSNGATYTLGSVPAAGCSTADQAGLSGVDTQAIVSVSGPASGVGSFTATCSGATDLAGNSAAPVSVTYQVIYDWRGFFQPVDNLPALNKAKAGSAIPVKFSLGGNQGLNIFATGYPSSSPVTCGNTSAADSIEQTVTAGGSSLNYDATADQYVYVWKTTSSWANSCRTLTVKLVDGTVHQANFWFVK